jgi:hypothetical protein
VDDAYAALLARNAAREKVAQLPLGFRDDETVQIELGFDAVITPSQAAHDGVLHTAASVGEIVAELHIEIDRCEDEAVLEHLRLAETAKAGARWWWLRAMTNAGLVLQRFGTANRLTKGANVFLWRLTHPAATSNRGHSVYWRAPQVSKNKLAR